MSSSRLDWSRPAHDRAEPARLLLRRRAHGDDQYSVPHLVADAVGVLDALRLSSDDVVGHDWSSAVAWHLAGAHPDRVATMTGVSVPHPAAFGWALGNDAGQQRRSEYIKLFR